MHIEYMNIFQDCLYFSLKVGFFKISNGKLNDKKRQKPNIKLKVLRKDFWKGD